MNEALTFLAICACAAMGTAMFLSRRLSEITERINVPARLWRVTDGY